MTLSDKTILVTGATSGIGRATATKLIEGGATVIAVGRNSARLDEMATQWGNRCVPIEFDLTQDQQLGHIVDSLPMLNGVVMSAGIVKNNPIKFFNRAVFDEILTINLVSPLILSVELSNRKRLHVGSSLVFLS